MSAPTETSPTATAGKMSVPTLTGLVVGSMVGAGAFSLPARFGVRDLPLRRGRPEVRAADAHGRRIFAPAEVALFALLVAAGVFGAISLYTGRITI